MLPKTFLLTVAVTAVLAPAANAAASTDPLPFATRAIVNLLADRQDDALAGADVAAFREVRKRYECVTPSGARAEAVEVTEDSALVLVDAAAAAALPVTHTPQEFPANWLVRLQRDGERWRVASVSVPETGIAAAIALAPDAAARAAILRDCDGFVTPELARRICERGDALDSRCDSQHADDLADLARSIAVDWGNRAEEARAMWLHAKSLDTRDQTAASTKAYSAAWEVAKSAADSDLIAATLVGHGAERTRIGDMSFREDFETGYRMALQTGNERVAAMAIFRSGIVAEYEGRYVDALRKYDEAVQRAERAGDVVVQAWATTEIGVTYDYMNNRPLSFPYMRRGIALFRKAHNNRGVIRSLRNFADMEAADSMLDEVEELLKQVPNPRTSAYVCATRATIAAERRDPAAVERYCTAGLALAKQTGTEIVATVLMHQLAMARLEQKRYDEAVSLARVVVERARTLTPDFDAYWHAQQTLGRGLVALGKTKEGREAYAEAIAAIERSRSNVPGAGDDQQLFFDDKPEPYYETFRTYIDEDPGQAVLWVERGRAGTLLDLIAHGRKKSTRSLSEGEQREEAAIEQTMVDLNVALRDERARTGADAARIASLERALAEARRKRSVLTRRLYDSHPELALARGDVPLPAFDEIRKAIPRDGAVLEYVSLPRETWLVVITRDAAPAIYRVPGETNSLRKLAGDFARQIYARDIRFRASAHKLYDLLIAPAEPLLRGKKIVCFIADNALWNIPYHALLDRENHYVVEKRAVFYAPSLAFLVWQTNHRRAHATLADTRLLAFGNPAIASATVEKAHSLRRDESLGALPEAEQEVRALKSIYGAAHTTLRVGTAATETEFKTNAGHYRMLHLATHGMYDDADPMYSHLVLSRTPDDANDGLLEAREIVNLNLDSDLAVLSACETGRGQARGGEGMIGLSWALLAAGCRTEVLAQSKIGSASARDLMVSFHRSLAPHLPLASGRSVTQALRESQLKMLHGGTRAHPFYWAPFVVVGEGW
jgi:CHAT domain-containing protein